MARSLAALRPGGFTLAVGLALALGAVPLFTSLLPPAQVAFYASRLLDLPLLILAGIATELAARRHTGQGRRFWRLWTWAIVSYLVGRELPLFPLPVPEVAASLVQEGAYLTWYVLAAAALELSPGSAPGGPVEVFQRRVWGATAVAHLVTMTGFFVLIPVVVNPQAYGSGGPSLLMYAVLDLYLTFRLAVLHARASPGYWRRVYGGLTVVALLWAGLDLLEGLGYLRIVTGLDHHPGWNLIWLAPMVALVATARVSWRGDHGVEGPRALAPPGDRPALAARAVPFLMLAVPAIHFGMYWAGWLDQDSRVYREIWVLVALVVFTTIGLWYQAGLERLLARLALDAARREEALARSQRLEVVSRLSAGVAHDFNNLLTVILNGAELLRDAPAGVAPEWREEAAEIAQAGQRGAKMVQRLLTFGAGRDLQVGPLDLGRLVADLLPTLRRLIPATVTLRFDPPGDPVPVLGDQTAIEEIVINLATNARDAMTDGGVLTLQVHPLDDSVHGESGQWAALVVRDTGVGMAPETVAHIFEPYYTTKSTTGGTGLGLAMVYGLTRQLKGQLDVESTLGAGTTMRLLLPAASQVPMSTPGPVPAPTGFGTVLLVEDDAAVRRTTERVLMGGGYDVVSAEDGLVALELLTARGGEVRLVVSDLTMPRLGGIELFHRARERFPLPFVLVSGYPVDREALAGATGVVLLRKPVGADQLLRVVAELLAGDPGGVSAWSE